MAEPSPAEAYAAFRSRQVLAGAGRVRRRLRLRLRRLPARGLRPRRGRLRRPGRGADRGRQDDRRRVRRLPGPAAGPQVLLHHADQGAVQPEVRRPGPPARRGPGRAADRRLLDQLRGAGGGDDHRGAAQHDLRRLVDPGQPRLRGDGRGALPGRPVPRRGLGGGDHRAGRVDPGGRPVGDGEQRRGVRRVAGGGARRDGRGGLRAAAGAAVPARAGRDPALRPVRRRRADRAGGARRAERGQPGPAPGGPGGVRLVRDDSRRPRGAGGRGRRNVALRQRGVRRRPAGPRPSSARRGQRPRSLYGPGRPDIGRAAGPGRAAAGDRVHLLPGRLRRGGAPDARLGPAADHRRASGPRSPRSSTGTPPGCPTPTWPRWTTTGSPRR